MKLRFNILTVCGILLIIVTVFSAAMPSDENTISIIYPEISMGVIKENKGGIIIETYDPGETESHISAIPGSAEPIVNINTATAQELDEFLPGIGPAKARAIVEYRTLVGGFLSVWELDEVEGIGEKLLEQIIPHCTVGEPEE